MKIKKNKAYLLFLSTALSLSAVQAFGQEDLEKELAVSDVSHEKVSATFKSTKLINGHTNEP